MESIEVNEALRLKSVNVYQKGVEMQLHGNTRH